MMRTLLVCFGIGWLYISKATAENDTNALALRIALFWITQEQSTTDQPLASKLEAITSYFDRVSFAKVRMEFRNSRVTLPAPKFSTLEKPDASEMDRKALLKQLLAKTDRSLFKDSQYALIISKAEIWPYCMPYPSADRPEIRAAGIICAETDWGTIAHEIGHLIGLPDLYDHRLAAKGLTAANQFGPWCLMSRSVMRPGLCGWSRLFLGWIPDSQIVRIDQGKESYVLLDALEAGGTNSLLIAIHLGSRRQYFVEARTRVGLDTCLPQEGILITRVDSFASHYSDRVRVVDACPETTSLDDAAFRPHGERCEFNDVLQDVQVVVLGRTGHAYSLYVRNGNIRMGVN